MKPLKEKVSLTLDGPVLERVQTLAEGDDRSLSSYINQVLKAHLEELDRKKEA
ncbi:toxin-antitoxin system protein [Intestinimonas sp.]|uniref:toxin-antitoxin system protein n=1 Tax=Intestinimonas sp. TaxID=1965293 RepID=UPI00260BABAF|nr:toxin-antitoxin system protein [Intestinimonas sp.]